MSIQLLHELMDVAMMWNVSSMSAKLASHHRPAIIPWLILLMNINRHSIKHTNRSSPNRHCHTNVFTLDRRSPQTIQGHYSKEAICQRLNGTETISQQKKRKHTSLRATSVSLLQQKSNKTSSVGEKKIFSRLVDRSPYFLSESRISTLC